MLRTILLTATLALGGMGAAHAFAPGAPPGVPGPVLPGDGAVVPVSGGCGPYAFRDGYGYCRPIRPGYRPHVCPPYFHLGVDGFRCWPNR